MPFDCKPHKEHSALRSRVPAAQCRQGEPFPRLWDSACGSRVPAAHLYLRYPGLSVHPYLRYWRRQDRLAQAVQAGRTFLEALEFASMISCGIGAKQGEAG